MRLLNDGSAEDQEPCCLQFSGGKCVHFERFDLEVAEDLDDRFLWDILVEQRRPPEPIQVRGDFVQQ